MNIVSLFSVIIWTTGSSSTINEEGWQYYWVCDYRLEQCQRKSTVTSQPSEPRRYDSLPLCRLICGQYGALWPKPTVSTYLQRDLIPFHPDSASFEIAHAAGEAQDFLIQNSKIFRENIWADCGGNCSIVPNAKVKICISIESSSSQLNWDTDESYSLNISSSGQHVTVHISGKNVFGARHGLETLTQLIASYPMFPRNKRNFLRGLVIISGATIRDKPVYSHRGLLLDTARNYLPLRVIKKQINGMASVKLNVLHWHATDSQSFPLVSTRVPQMSRYGAYSQDMVYSPSEVKDLFAYAKLRGIRIILEIDSPSHAGFGWQWGPQYNLGNLSVCVGQEPWRSYCIEPPCGQLNPVNPNMYTILGALYNDFIDIFPKGEAFHMGGDEVFIGCWNSSKEIVNYLIENGKGVTMKDFHDLWGEFQSSAMSEYDKIVGNKETPIIVWSSGLTHPDVITNYLPKERYVIQTWVPYIDPLPERLILLGYKIIISTKDAWYLDHGFWGSTTYHTWRVAYNNLLPRTRNVLGGEVCMWGEYVDEYSLDNRIWPRAAAAAERLWSDPTTGTPKAESRLLTHRERLVTRGFRPELLAPYWCYQNEGLCT